VQGFSLSEKGSIPRGLKKNLMRFGICPLEGGGEGKHGNAGDTGSSGTLHKLPEKGHTLPLHKKGDFAIHHGSQKLLKPFKLLGIPKTPGSAVGYVEKITLIHLLGAVKVEENRRTPQMFEKALVPIPGSSQRGML
jgi:hypothetical protein